MSRFFFLNGECVIFRTLPRTHEPYIEARTFNVQKALDKCSRLNLGADYEHFEVRVFFYNKFYKVNQNGSRGEVSLVQMWKVEQTYLNRHRDSNNWGGILVCKCSYPYFASEVANPDDGLSEERKALNNSDDYAVTQPVTCLEDDFGREIDYCPNCNSRLYWEKMSGLRDQATQATKKSSKTSKKNKGYEYVVLQSYPLAYPLNFVIRTYNYQQAHSTMKLENLSKDRKGFVMRIIENGKLYKVAAREEKGNFALEQNWQIAGEYLTMSRRDTNDSAIIRCECSYPYFSSVVSESHIRGLHPETKPVTCLKDDFGREITRCPNCGRELFEEEGENYPEVRTFETPNVCIDCQNYYGKSFNGTHLICAIYPHGWNGDECPDYTA